MELNDQMKTLLKDLSVALHHALTKDQNIKQVTDKIKGNGYDIYLIMEANIALDKREEEGEGTLFLGTPEERYEMEDHQFNKYDRDFLASMKIRVDEFEAIDEVEDDCDGDESDTGEDDVE
ncbi:hypothetical protein SCOR_12045 [Sulfidibacter corallicola]|uniref:Uncharacterized protein n=1 Tax=Sulfidibacter corallicola TaxID=2818388 RepID=A0A8A4TGT5_SULCO|nr:hypothetical protein [Sulfidibacter corallicola]QTD47938.1 hypothetical protein J3U87_20320 [Sulfidibacter corallicola]